MIFAHTCLKCGRTCEPFLVEVSQVLAVSCGDCLTFIRYGHVREYPDTQAVKTAIWDLCLRKPELVQKLFNGKTYPRAVYWRVYRELVHKLEKPLKTFGT
jgi:hypothetical protein